MSKSKNRPEILEDPEAEPHDEVTSLRERVERLEQALIGLNKEFRNYLQPRIGDEPAIAPDSALWSD